MAPKRPAPRARTAYVALLRGINVGGNNMIRMKDLAATFAGMKLEAVKTFIASGNVLLRRGPRTRARWRGASRRPSPRRTAAT